MSEEEKPRYIAWRGGQCPVPPEAMVDVVFRCGDMDNKNNEYEAQEWLWDWEFEEPDYHIIAYRVLED